MKRALLILLAAVAALLSQTTGQPVGIVQFPNQSPTRVMDYAGGSNLTYLGQAPSLNPTPSVNPGYWAYSLSVTGGTLTSIAVSSNVGTVTTVSAHGLLPGETVVVSGSTTSALNASYSVVSVTSGTAFTITTSGVGNATYNNGPLTVSGNSPLTTSPIWSIQHFTYDASNNLIGTQCANGACNQLINIWANRATLVYK
jgi:hypothetical protein